ncbi:hypothetical protein BSNK01_01150 [Bacillaceae bacterium]
MLYKFTHEEYCCEWTIGWNFPMEGFVKDGESSGFGRFVGVADGYLLVELWFAKPAVKIRHAEGISVQIDTDHKVITILQEVEP